MGFWGLFYSLQLERFPSFSLPEIEMVGPSHLGIEMLPVGIQEQFSSLRSLTCTEVQKKRSPHYMRTRRMAASVTQGGPSLGIRSCVT